MSMLTLMEKLKKKRLVLEGNIIGIMYKDLETAFMMEIDSGFFEFYNIYHTIFYLAIKRGSKVITKNEIALILNDNPYLQEDFKKVGGLKQLESLKKTAVPENLESYESDLIKCEVIIRLLNNGVINESEAKEFIKYSISKIQNLVELKYISVFSDIPGKTKGVDFMTGIRENMKETDEGSKMGLPFLCPYLTERTMGRITKNVSILALPTGFGKTAMTTMLCLIANIKLKEKMTIFANEENY